VKQIIKRIKAIFSTPKSTNQSGRLIGKSELPHNNVGGFINHATHDYIGARLLLIQGLAGPGTILAVTALEKIMKSYLLEEGYKVRRDGKGHNLEILTTQINEHDSNFLNTDERKFLRHINKAYKLRYPTEISTEFETFLPSKKILANMDSLFCKFIECPTLDKVSKDSKWYDMFKIGAMPKVQLTNCNINFGTDRKNLIESCQSFVAHFPKNDGNYSRFATTNEVKDDSNWSIPNSIKSQ